MQNNKSLLIGVGGFVIGLIISPLFFHGGNSWTGTNMMGNQTSQSNSMIGNIDENFIEQMIPHHESAIAMANFASSKAEHSEIKQLSQNIITSQTLEINEMKGWYKQWFGKDVVIVRSGMMGNSGSAGGMMNMGMMGDQTDMTKLQNSKPFDKAFIEEMIPHHQMAVMMAHMLETSTTRPEMKKLAQNIITAQTNEINQMREWYKTWYN